MSGGYSQLLKTPTGNRKIKSTLIHYTWQDELAVLGPGCARHRRSEEDTTFIGSILA